LQTIAPLPGVLPNLRQTGDETPADNDMGDYSESQYDSWSGYSQPLFNFGDYNEEDKEADEVYNMFD